MQAGDLHKGIGSIYDAGVGAVPWTESLTRLAHMCNSRASTFFITDLTGPRLLQFEQIDMSEEGIKEYGEYYLGIDPRFKYGQKVTTGQIMVDYNFITEAEMDRDEYYADFLRRYDYRYFAAVSFPVESNIEAHLTLQRAPREGPVEAHDAAVLGILLPHVRRAMQIQWRFREIETERDNGQAALEQLSQGIILAELDGTVVLANASAEVILGQNDGLTVSGGRLLIRQSADSALLFQLLASAVRQSTGDIVLSGGVMAVRRPSGKRPYTLLVAPLGRRESAEFLGVGMQSPLAMIFVNDPAAIPVAPAEHLQQLLRLTRAEANVVSALANGTSLNTYAEQIGRSKETVRAHLKSAMAKTDTHSQSELVRLVLLTAATVSNGATRDA